MANKCRDMEEDYEPLLHAEHVKLLYFLWFVHVDIPQQFRMKVFKSCDEECDGHFGCRFGTTLGLSTFFGKPNT